MTLTKLHKAIAMMKLYGASKVSCREFALVHRVGKRAPARAMALICKEDIRTTFNGGTYIGGNKYLAKAVKNVILPFSTSGK